MDIVSRVEVLTDKLLQERINQTLAEFIAHQTAMGADATGIQASLMVATGELYDRRTVVKWMDTYQ